MAKVFICSVFEIRQSAKGWSEPYAFFVSAVMAHKECDRLNAWSREHRDGKLHFRVVERPLSDPMHALLNNSDYE